MTRNIRRSLHAAAIALTLSLPLSAAWSAEEVNIQNGYAVHGYDVVAYFTEGEPTLGVDEFQTEYDGATFRFASADHLAAFEADPEAYVPAYGGFCAFGTAMGRKFDGDPQVWKIVDGKLYLNVNQSVQERWEGDIPGFVRGADNNWQVIQAVADKDLEQSPPEGVTLGAQ